MKPLVPVEGGGPVGCGCGMILGAAIAFVLLADQPFAVMAAGAASVVSGFAGWKLGDRYFEKILGAVRRFWW